MRCVVLKPVLGMVCLSLTALTLMAAAEPSDGAYGQALDTRRGAVIVPANAAYSALPLTVECRVKLLGKDQYNILMAQETKASGTHWEVFTSPGDGFLHAYIPGWTPDHLHTDTVLVDGQWHWVKMTLETARIRLFVDGVEKASAAVAFSNKARVPGSLAMGALAEGGLACSGLIDEVRLSSGLRPDDEAHAGECTPDEATIGLWHFAADGLSKDASKLAAHGALRNSGVTMTDAGIEIPGGMSTELIPLPPAEDAGPLRSALTEAVNRIGLKTVAADAVRDAVLREWSWDFQCKGEKEYPESRPGGPGADKLAREVYDPAALVLPEDGGPLGTVLRRTEALMAYWARTESTLPDKEALGTDLAAVRAAATGVAPDAPAYKGLYLAACAVRRQIVLRNPLLDFDALLCVARGTFEGSVRSNPNTADVQGGHFVTQYFGFNALPGGGLYIIRNYKGEPEVINLLADAVVQNGRLKGQKLDHGALATPDLSYDGKSVVFAWTENQEHQWIYAQSKCFHLFRVNVDGTDLVQLTDDEVNDFSPCWLPNGRIAFVSERRGGYIRCFSAYLKVRSYTLFSMNADGSDIAPLSFFETSEWNPSVNNEGQLVYTRWDYVDRENCLGTRFWISNPDGTNPRAPHGNYPLPYHTFPDHTPWKVENGREWDSRFGAPMVEMDIRAIPDSPLYIFTAAPHHGSVYGSLCMLDLRQEDDHHMGQVKRITPDEPFPETETPGRRHYKYGMPWPLNEDFYVCNIWENIALVDRFGNKELLCDLRSMPCAQDDRLRLADPIPLRPRACPTAIPPKARTASNPNASKATISLMNVYASDLPFPEGVKIKWLRVIQNIPKTNHAMGEPLIGYERENTPRIPLGIVPVEEDGSAYFEAPVAKQLIFQALDENYMAVQSMRSVAFVHPGEQLSCYGCHEPTQQAPQRNEPPLAMRRAPSPLTPECGPVEPVSYYRQIKPIFDQQCLPCHIEKKRGLQDMSYDHLKEDYTFWFSGAMLGDMTTAYSGVHGGSRTIPGRFGARASKIGQVLMGEKHQQSVPAAARHQVIQWLDCNSLRLGAYTREAAQLKGELVWPALDVDPANPVGVEGTVPVLSSHFWHENLDPRPPLLFSEHAHDRVAIMDASGNITWEYAVPHPQDVWMLPNGNILTTYYQGVREVTPNKEVVWEYTTEKPNEIPNCQPLPDGNVMIGIVGECRLIEVNRAGTIVHQVQLSTTETTPHAQFRMCRKTPEGTYLVPFTAEGAVREYDRDGNILREFPPCSTPVCALRLENGNTLISADRAVTEYTPDGRIAWALREHDIPGIELAIPAGIRRLKNGVTIVCNWNTHDTPGKSGAHIFAVTDDKRVIWQVTGDQIGQAAQCQLLYEDPALAETRQQVEE